MINYKQGNIFNSNMETLVNPINCIGVMGKGLAKTFKQRYPKMYKQHQKMCHPNLIHPGYLYPYYGQGIVKVLNFPTKLHWRNPSRIQYIQERKILHSL